MKAFLTVDEMAAVLKVPKSWLYARTRQKGKDIIPMIRIGKYVRFEADSVITWVRQYGGIL